MLQHCKEKHLHRYLAQFDFDYNAFAWLSASTTMSAQSAR